MIYTSCWVTCGILWDNAIWLTNNLIFSDNFQKVWFYMRFSSKVHANMKKEARRHRKWENRSSGWPQGHQKWAKGYQKWAQREPKGAKRAPKVSQMDQNGDQNQHKINIKDRVAKKMKKGGARGKFLDAIWGPFSIKNRWTNQCGNRYRKSNGISWKIDAKMKLILGVF